MNLNISIKDIGMTDLSRLDIKCFNCDFWFDTSPTSLLEDFYGNSSLLGLLRSKIFERRSKNIQEGRFLFFKKSGGKIKGAFVRNRCIGIIFAGKYYLFPKIKSFNVYPPDNDSIFLGCIYVKSDYKGMGVGKRLLFALEKDLVREKFNSIETIGKRLNDDIDEEEYRNSPLIPMKFLIQNGFYIKKNDELFPLLRLDLATIERVYMKEKLLSKDICLEKGFGSSLVVRKRLIGVK